MEFSHTPNYYINFQNESVEFENLEDIEDKNNIKFLEYRGFDESELDFSIFKNVVKLYIILPYIKNIIFGNLSNLKYLYINGSVFDSDTDERIDNYFLEELNISNCHNIVYFNLLYMRNLKYIKHDLLKKLCKFNIFISFYKSEVIEDFINKYNIKNIKRYKKEINKNLKHLSRKRINLLAEFPLKGTPKGLSENGTPEGLSETDNCVCLKCGNYVKDELLINVSDIHFKHQLFRTYTCC